MWVSKKDFNELVARVTELERNTTILSKEEGAVVFYGPCGTTCFDGKKESVATVLNRLLDFLGVKQVYRNESSVKMCNKD